MKEAAQGTALPEKRLHKWITRALDGGEVEVRSAVPIGDVTHSVMVELRALGIKSTEVCAAGLGYADELARSPEIAIGMRFDETYSFQGGRLRIGTGRQPIGPDKAEYWERGPDGRNRRKPIRMAVWTGRRHELHVVQYGGEVERLLSIFRQFQIRETTHGVICTPRNAKETIFYEGPTAIFGIPQLGILEVEQFTKQVARALPGHRGTPVAGGDLYAGQMASGDNYYLLRSRNAKVTLVPDARPQVLAQALETLQVDWRAGR
ncbi:hypothetical protein SMC26_17585 [Actinomadura fulvescens]|uniref:Uncharacterized protein n=1 Tax=Actinomadura fulvescens TaxID=46160 RepID=A0ABN3Q0H0_9ACTN